MKQPVAQRSYRCSRDANALMDYEERMARLTTDERNEAAKLIQERNLIADASRLTTELSVCEQAREASLL